MRPYLSPIFSLLCLACASPTLEEDEDCPEGNSRPCAVDGKFDGSLGLQVCTDHAWSVCVKVEEICNGKDDDGDGLTDESLVQPCATPCGTGQETCVNGRWENCTAPTPSAEICDGKDNDCDGQIDNNIEPRICNLGCGDGVEICHLGHWQDCDAAAPLPEICDGLDNDCDGETDELLVQDCTTLCESGFKTCELGRWSDCSARQPALAENCADGTEAPNGIDDDCNGQTDDGCGDCIEGQKVACSKDEGICQQGEMTCKNGHWGECLLNGQPVIMPNQFAETCDGKDNDCDGATDETFEHKDEPCGQNTGNCIAGITVCENGSLVCKGETKPSREICDGKDNDCDGQIDNNIAADSNEPNETCLQSKLMGTLPETPLESSTPIQITGNSLYPRGDVDVFTVITTESSNWCFPGTNEDPIVIGAYLTHLPAGVEYELCIQYGENIEDLSNYCASGFGQAYCTTTVTDGTMQIAYSLSNSCGSDSSARSLITVRPVHGKDFSCYPYTLGVFSYTEESE